MYKQLFPQELLTKSHEERLNYFRKYTVSHEIFDQTSWELIFAIQDAQPGTLIFLYGPSGVGKTTMLKLTERYLTKQILPQLKVDLNRIPIIRINAVEPDSGSFDWKDFFQRFLIKLNDPLPEEKLDLRLATDIYKQNKNLLELNDQGSARRYRRTVENLIECRKPLAVLIDEAQHIGKVVSSRKLLNQLNVIKCLANESKSVYVLSGTYELIPFLNLNDQLARRSINIHFSRYKVENKDDCEIFIETLKVFQQHLPVEVMPDLVSSWRYFYNHTIGCIGTLNDWLERALSISLREGGKEMKSEHWEKRAPNLSQCKKKFADILVAENILKEDAGSWLEFSNKLELSYFDDVFVGADKETRREENAQTKQPRKARHKRGVGIRNPHRDPIGKIDRAKIV